MSSLQNGRTRKEYDRFKAIDQAAFDVKHPIPVKRWRRLWREFLRLLGVKTNG